jgi:hypothetical protein
MARPRRGSVGPLTDLQRDELVTWGGLDPESHFASERERCEAWEHHRDELMEEARREAREHPTWCRRPWAWWEYDLDRDEPHDQLELVRVLVEQGELLLEERAALAERGHEAKLRLGTGRERRRDPRDAAVLRVLEGAAAR